jgi:hypothetical protein
MVAADDSLISRADLRAGRLAMRPQPQAYGPRFVENTPPVPSYWQTTVTFGEAHLVLRLETAGGEPQREQLAFVDRVQQQYLFFLGSALVLMKPAFQQHVGEQDELRVLQEEFVPTALFVSEVSERPARWELLFRCKTDPRYEFRVRYEGLRAERLLVDLTE